MAESSLRSRSVEPSAHQQKSAYNVSSISQDSADSPYYDSLPFSETGHELQHVFQNNENDKEDLARLGKKQEFIDRLCGHLHGDLGVHYNHPIRGVHE
ncbi:hypothetical protein LTR62_006655 [Meristemomyces frigidus]|uniref:Uncharacterized protein n=1 Tax=Meristemomyces frigidus TaxID=1508187 RepID=A0AAN7TMK9_9PEZI|nr:hypothetical protein LTR62_006655 [Meristemomyces frigidus]